MHIHAPTLFYGLESEYLNGKLFYFKTLKLPETNQKNRVLFSP